MNAFAEVLALKPLRHGGAAPAANLPSALPAYDWVVDLLPQAILLVQEDRTVLATNPVAHRLIEGGCIRLCDGHLSHLGQISTLQLARMLAQAATGSALECAVWFERNLSTGLLHLSRSQRRTPELPGCPSSNPVLLVVQLDQPALTQRARIDALTHQCRLSQAERHVLLLLADGEPVDATSRHLGLCVSTVRSHVRNLLGKTQAPTLMQLLRWTGSASALPN